MTKSGVMLKMARIPTVIRDSVIERDSAICRVSGQQANSIHHIVYKSLGGNNSSYNLICLSNKQHIKVHANGKKWFKILFNMQKEIYPNLTKEMMKK